ncbi:MAG TPA: RdgB/HAM1 family non-canonical purine NTP pyrophosphatase [Crocinitomicaceae bacterium]|nr:RdgB/HAM1 family non-canonical purine NTP pyrophosphatase [Crocinitomicaceae bacterium]
MKALLCTTNKGKVKEFKDKLLQVDFYTLKDENIFIDINENGHTFEKNARIKLNTILETYPILKEKYDFILAEDSGLCVESLDFAPGIYSARYAGEHGNDDLNNSKLLHELKNQSNRNAFYEVCIAVFHNGTTHIFSGKVHGTIATEPTGTNGFGYDPLFIPNGFSKTFGELDTDIKLKISHRTKAIELMKEKILKNKFI